MQQTFPAYPPGDTVPSSRPTSHPSMTIQRKPGAGGPAALAMRCRFP
ncbi:hypothetical protein CFter6_5133 [Collimonas fungivorans]|uniref:Uncharacterized protein n=1 Tax=Collimonas fungivorans TaxID=158899 RepID=A0A127PIZ3_9BURK|nr:hypothetical protein CFter6_5133 [Collimonas fungivorans]